MRPSPFALPLVDLLACPVTTPRQARLSGDVICSGIHVATAVGAQTSGAGMQGTAKPHVEASGTRRAANLELAHMVRNPFRCNCRAVTRRKRDLDGTPDEPPTLIVSVGSAALALG